jgi:AcrR family transcriptional regulator
VPRTKAPTKQRSYHHGDLRRALVETSIELLEEGGVEALSVAEAGRRLGVSSAAPYKHFADRRELLHAVAAEGNRRLTEHIIETVGAERDPRTAFALSGVAYIEWAANNAALYRVTFDPANIEFSSTDHEGARPPEGLESMATFWPSLAARVRANEPLTAEDPLLEELAGRALAHGMASLFVNGVFASLGIGTTHARRLARAVVGLSPEVKPAPKKRRGPQSDTKRVKSPSKSAKS